MNKWLTGLIIIITAGIIDNERERTAELEKHRREQETSKLRHQKEIEERQSLAGLLFLLAIICLIFAFFTGDNQPFIFLISAIFGIGGGVTYFWE